MGRISRKDYDKISGEKGEKIYRLSAEAVKSHSKKELAGIPVTVTVHTPDDETHIAEELAKSACKVLAKRFGIE